MKKRYIKWINKNVNDLKSKAFVVTGGTGSIGKATINYLSYLGANVIIAVRNEKKGLDLISELKVQFPTIEYSLEVVDFSSIESTTNFISRLKEIDFDYYITTAGVYHLPEKITADKMECQFETNYYNQIKVIKELGACHKYIVVSSLSHRYTKIDFENVMSLNVKNKTKVYARSKRLLTYHLLALQNKGYDIRITHPGVSATSLFHPTKGGFGKAFSKLIFPLMKIIFHSPEKGALSIMYAIDNVPNYGYEIGPRGILGVWGYPKISKLQKALKCQKNQNIVEELFENSKNL